MPYVMLSGAIGAISNGLFSTFSPTTSTGKLVGYQILNGVRRGLGMQMVRGNCTPSALLAIRIGRMMLIHR
jgi:hypothetical protein